MTLFFPAGPVPAQEDAATPAWKGLQRHVLQTYAAATWPVEKGVARARESRLRRVARRAAHPRRQTRSC